MMMTNIEALISDLLGSAMNEIDYLKCNELGNDAKLRWSWWFVNHVKGYWLERCIAERES